MSRFVTAAAVILLLASCGDSAGPGAGDAEKLIVDPQDVFVSQGSDRTVLVRVVDGVGAAMDASVTVESVGPGISLTAATGYPAPEDSDGVLVFHTSNRELALSVSGDELTRTSFRLAARGREAGATVTVLPAGTVPVQLSAAELVIGDTITLDVSPPLKLREDFHLLDARESLACYVNFPCPGFRTLDVSDDGRRATVLPLEAFDGRVELQGAALDYAGELSLRVKPEESDLRVSPSPRPLDGTADSSTAPSITMPLPGDTVNLIDAPPLYAGLLESSKYYRLVASRSASFIFEIRPDPYADYQVYVLEEGANEWTLITASIRTWGRLTLFNGNHLLQIVADDCCRFADYIRLDISAEPQSP